jgi:UDP-2,4-diacetamido-2,4,6-trideoxy-beta-L-altropyranose hydrolase
MVIDDLADRSHDCDLLLDQNLGRNEEDYMDLLMGESIQLIGPKYALLRPEFALLRSQSLARRKSKPQLRQLLITMGGVDKENATSQILNALKACQLPADLHIVIVMGPHAPWLDQVQALSLELSWRNDVLIGVNNMAQLMVDSDLAIGAAGSTSWELCCLGLPSFTLVLAENQLTSGMALHNAGAAILVNSSQQIIDFLVEPQMSELTVGMLANLSKAAADVTDGQGCIRTVKHMIENVHA